MQRTPHRCPDCSHLLSLSSDMWGLYYLCPGCGWTCEDDDRISDAWRSPWALGHLPGAQPDLTPGSRRQHPAA